MRTPPSGPAFTVHSSIRRRPMQELLANGNYAPFLSQALTPPMFGGTGMMGAYGSHQGIGQQFGNPGLGNPGFGQFGQGQFGQGHLAQGPFGQGQYGPGNGGLNPPGQQGFGHTRRPA